MVTQNTDAVWGEKPLRVDAHCAARQDPPLGTRQAALPGDTKGPVGGHELAGGGSQGAVLYVPHMALKHPFLQRGWP